jgi:drug/metabolite transporter (DMT)-like permease
MDSPIPADILALACGVAGWFYLFYSKAATKLSGVESPRQNNLRVTLRRTCGAALVLLGALFFAGFNIDEHRTPGAYLTIWSTALVLLLIIIALVAADLRLTYKLRHQKPKNHP